MNDSVCLAQPTAFNPSHFKKCISGVYEFRVHAHVVWEPEACSQSHSVMMIIRRDGGKWWRRWKQAEESSWILFNESFHYFFPCTRVLVLVSSALPPFRTEVACVELHPWWSTTEQLHQKKEVCTCSYERGSNKMGSWFGAFSVVCTFKQHLRLTHSLISPTWKMMRAVLQFLLFTLDASVYTEIGDYYTILFFI